MGRAESPPAGAAAHPAGLTVEISVVVTMAYRGLLALADSLARQTLPPSRFELIVATHADGRTALRPLRDLDAPFAVDVVEVGRPELGHLWNAAIQAARGHLCVLLGAGVVPLPELLAEHLAAHAGGADLLAVGTSVARPEGGWRARAAADASNRRSDALTRRAVGWRDAGGGNLSVARDTLLRAGCFSLAVRQREPDLLLDLAFRLVAADSAPRRLPRVRAERLAPGRPADLVQEPRDQAVAHVELARGEPAMLHSLLGWFTDTTAREVVLRRVFLALHIPPRAALELGVLARGPAQKAQWATFVWNLTYWQTVRRLLPRKHWRRLARGMPVLLYHAVGERDESDRFVVSRRDFDLQLRLLRLLRIRVVTFDELVSTLREYRLPPARVAAITFDDGYADNASVALPALERRGFPATVYLVSDRLGGRNDWSSRGALQARALVAPDQLSSLRQRGFAFGAHTQTHPALPDVPDAVIDDEIRRSKADIEGILGEPVRSFAYPYGRYDERAITAVRAAGFVGAATTEPRLARLDDDPLLIPRIEIRGHDSPLRFLLKLWLGIG